MVPGYLCLGAGLVTEVKQGRSGPPTPVTKRHRPPPFPSPAWLGFPGPPGVATPAEMVVALSWWLSQPNPRTLATALTGPGHHIKHRAPPSLLHPLPPQVSPPLSSPENPGWNLSLGPGSATGPWGSCCRAVEKVLDRESGHPPLAPVGPEQVTRPLWTPVSSSKKQKQSGIVNRSFNFTRILLQELNGLINVKELQIVYKYK